jgi:hypothetical protein
MSEVEVVKKPNESTEKQPIECNDCYLCDIVSSFEKNGDFSGNSYTRDQAKREVFMILGSYCDDGED